MLIPRLYDVQAGAVRLNGVDVRDATLESVQQRVGVVTQDAHLFHDTLRANLIYARPDAVDADIRDALRAAQILEAVEALPNGLDTMVGERGYRFSGGEKQRLAIARLLLKAPPPSCSTKPPRTSTRIPRPRCRPRSNARSPAGRPS